MEAFEANNVGNLINILELVPKVLVYTLYKYAEVIILSF